MTLTKAQIVEEIRQRNGFSRKKSIETVEAMLEIMKESLASGENVLISGFGKFCVKEKRERKGRNPATGESMKIPEANIPKFKPGKKLKDAVQ